MTFPFSDDKLKELFNYVDGDLIRLESPSSTALVGSVAGTITRDGYISVGVLGKIYRAHRLIWYYHNGSCPKMLDHINGCRSDNRIENLQPITCSQNLMKSKDRSSSSHRGVYPNNLRWYSIIIVNRKRISLGHYDNKEDAIASRIAGEIKYYGDYTPVDRNLELLSEYNYYNNRSINLKKSRDLERMFKRETSRIISDAKSSTMLRVDKLILQKKTKANLSEQRSEILEMRRIAKESKLRRKELSNTSQ